jgi:uncharacterized membrane protein (DUF2068 family)
MVNQLYMLKGVFSSPIVLALATVALFVCICQLVSNHGLIRLKRFVSWFSTKLCNYFFFFYI